MTDHLQETLVRLLRTPTGVPPGETEIAPGSPAIVAAVREVIRPMVESLDPVSIDEDGDANLVARFGRDPDRGVLLLVYVVSQHANEMADPTSGRIVDGAGHGLRGPCAVGQGATQNKGALAAVLTALRDLPADLRTGVTLGVNTEGRSSHGGARALLEGLGATGAWGVVAIGTDLQVSVGNRGRLDVRLVLTGRSAHSSQPWLGANPIPAAADAIAQLRDVPMPEPHPLLGAASLTPYLFRCEPIAPHTIPHRVEVTIDRRLLPGEEPERALADVRSALSPADEVTLEVSAGRMMWPAVVDPEHPGVEALVRGVGAEGRPSGTFISQNAFDAGEPCRAGIPTVMFGPGRRRFGGAGMLGEDLVAVDDCRLAASALRAAILDWDGHAG